MRWLLFAGLPLLLAVAGAARADQRVELFAGEPAAALELERVRVFRSGARVVVHGATGLRAEPLPATRYYRGTVQGEPGSLAVLAVEPDGRRRGLAVARDRRFLLSGDRERLVAIPEPAADGPVAGDRCAAASARLPPPGGAGRPPAPDRLPAPGDGMLAAVVAVETDWELYSILGSTAAVVGHVGDLFATVGAIYRRDLGTDVELGDLFVWESPNDPFTVESGFLDALYELGDHWHAEHPEVERALAHLVSGKGGILGGIAYHGVLCRADTPVGGHWGGGYSLAGAHTAFGPFRDAWVTAHELGHNFRAYHTHCFNDLPNPGDPEIDRCASGEIRNDGNPCWAGAVSMPPDGGSIMSYCHLLPGGYGNLTLSLGAPGAFGVEGERVVERMRAHVESVACLLPADPTVWVDGFESGDTSRWSETVP